MNLGNWRSHPPQAEPPASQLVSALGRVREMRDQSAWEPLTPPSSIQERAERVSTVRQKIAMPNLTHEGNTGVVREFPSAWLSHTFGKTLLVILGLIAIVLVWQVLFED